jgi:hypothetical protein
MREFSETMNSRDGIPLPVKDPDAVSQSRAGFRCAHSAPNRLHVKVVQPAIVARSGCFVEIWRDFDIARRAVLCTRSAARLPERRALRQWTASAIRFSAGCGGRLAISGSGMTTITVVPLAFVTKSMSPPS